jgi:Ca-activated chloride channel family protein
LYDAIAAALEHIELGQRGKKALVIVTDGGDNFSRRTFSDVMQLIQRSPATVYTVGVYDPEDSDRNPRVLKRIAGVSGGECFLPGEFEQVIPTLTKIAKDIRSRYTMGYAPARTSDKATLRKIRVVATAPGYEKLVVRTRTSYVLPERAGSSAYIKEPSK